ncbi:4fb496d4-a1b2-4060-b885-375b5abc4400-CDS [Sclerotinia trifoliorum]|uniref:4fb496d4-a1b2-4060-b885-375b5abc4400-CDS n=1 Tax=Sclerotinia trifoliorum TaxID=28548 RepID=A0A8H2VT36_9HELO|nr:4fb496d4-a1b2-4060-b885-375b5abc4400-CDS [Sclerotinia trifoliorum]
MILIPEESRSNGVVDSGEFWERQYKRQCIDAQTTLIDGSVEVEVPAGPDPAPSEPRLVQPLDHPTEKRKISEVDTIPDENNWMGTDVLSLKYSQDHVMIVSYLYRISEDRQSLQLNPTPDTCRKLLELSWKALSNCIFRYTDIKGANYHSNETKCLMFLANKIIGTAILTHSLCSFFHQGLTDLLNLCAGSDEVMMIGFITKLFIGIVRSIDWQPRNELHTHIFDGILAVILHHVGKLISNLIFGEDVRAPQNPGNISSGQTFHQPSTTEL